MNNTTSEPRVLNGVDLLVLGETVAAITESPELAATNFQSSSQWDDDRRVTTTIDAFNAGGSEHRRPAAHAVVTDLPEALMGTDRGPSPLELATSALGACIATTLVAHASSRRIRLKRLEVQVSGAVDLRGILNLAHVRPGFEGLQVEIRLEADLTEEELTSFAEETLPLSPVLDLFLRGAPVAARFRVEGKR
jgi:uncharacterized OsmC-like protein